MITRIETGRDAPVALRGDLTRHSGPSYLFRMRAAVGPLLLAASLGACVHATDGKLLSRASYDMHCPQAQLRITKLDSRTRGVEGCGQQATYVESCDGDRSSMTTKCTWVLNTDSLPARDTAGGANPGSSAKQPAPLAGECSPPCSPGYRCEKSQCIAVCNPLCVAGTHCNQQRICELDTPAPGGSPAPAEP